jgi:hypothetical protein
MLPTKTLGLGPFQYPCCPLSFARSTETGQRRIPIESLMTTLHIIMAMVKYVILLVWQEPCKLN